MLAHGRMNSVLVGFEDGARFITNRHVVQKLALDQVRSGDRTYIVEPPRNVHIQITLASSRAKPSSQEQACLRAWVDESRNIHQSGG